MHFSKSTVVRTAAEMRSQLNSNQEFILSRASKKNEIRQYYRTLHHAWGAQHWWPAETPFEVIVGAYLTQNTAWTNVEKALANLRDAQLLTVEGMRSVRLAQTRAPDSAFGLFSSKGKAAEDVCPISRSGVRRFVRQAAVSTCGQAARRTAWLERHRARDRRLDPSLRGKLSGLRCRCVHAAHPRSAPDLARKSQLRRHSATAAAIPGATC